MFQHNQNVPVENTELADATLPSKKVQLENPELSPAGNAQMGFPGLAQSKVAPPSHLRVD